MNKGVIFDLDGTIYCGNSIIDGAIETIEKLKKYNYEVIFFTNNSTKTREEILDKLLSLGIQTELNRIYTSSFATAIYLNDNKIERIFLIGTESFKKELTKFNLEIVNEKSAEAVVIGLDTEFNYNKLSKALVSINNGAKIIVCNRDKNYPIEDGILRPGCNAMVSALLGSCDNKIDVDYVVGKPNTYLLETICKDWNLDKYSIYVVGDSLDSDIAMANNYNVNSILVGKNSQYMIKDIIEIIEEIK